MFTVTLKVAPETKFFFKLKIMRISTHFVLLFFRSKVVLPIFGNKNKILNKF